MKNFKALGFISGAVIAAIAVWGFNTWRHVGDRDRLMTALNDHCIAYVQSGAEPFVGLGRPAGVYDNVQRDARLTGGGMALVFDDRFVASWGDIANPSLRICRLDGRPTGATVQTFDVSLDGFVPVVTDAVQTLGRLRPDGDRSGGELDVDGQYRTLGWFEVDKPRDRGNRVVMSFVENHVTSVIVVRDTAP